MYLVFKVAGYFDGTMYFSYLNVLASVASKQVHVTKKHVLIGCKRDMFWCQTFEVWRR